MTAALEARGLGFSYGDEPVWEDVSLSLEAGQVAFLVGPNGAGKSTLLRCLAGWLAPSAGAVLLDGNRFGGRRRLAPRELVYVPDVPAFYDDLTAAEHISFVLAANDARDLGPRAEELMGRLGLVGHEQALPSSYSRGMREKLACVLALMLSPRVVLLDEPHGPLDPEAARALSGELSCAARAGAAILLSCHHDVPALEPDLVVRLEGGRLAREGVRA